MTKIMYKKMYKELDKKKRGQFFVFGVAFRVVLLCAVFVAIGVATGANAQTQMLPATGAGIEAAELSVMEKLFAMAYESASQESVVLTEEGTGGAHERIVLEATRLDERITFVAKRFGASGGVLFRSSMISETRDDVERVLARLAQALVDKVDAKKTKNLDNITQAETQVRRTHQGQGHNVLGARVIQPLHADVKYQAMVAAYYHDRREYARTFIGYGGGILIPVKGSEYPDYDFYEESVPRVRSYGAGIFADFEAGWFILDKDISPYLSGGAEFRLGDNDGLGATLVPRASVGLMFFRSSSSRLNIQLDVAQHIIAMNDKSPTEAGLTFGIAF